ncbi:MAG: HAMP domain-containing histidine kinase [Rhizobacter sp.]|nr:HAMP domain-containing histidine kinase [Chlorobiales bacterium]
MIDTVFQRLQQSWRRATLASLEASYRAGFLAELAVSNLARGRVFSLLLALLHLPLVYLDLQRVNPSQGYTYLFYMHLAVIGGCAVLAALTWLARPKSVKEITAWHQTLGVLCGAVLLLWTAGVSIVDQFIHGEITVYIIGAFGIAIAFLYRTRTSFILYFVSYLVLIVGLMQVQADPDKLTGNLTNATALAVLAFILSRVVFVGQMQSYYTRKREEDLRIVVEEQAMHLLRENERAEIALKKSGQLNDDLEASNLALREANELKSELLSIAAHDLKNPLQTIMGFAELLISEPGASSATRKKLGVISESSNRMLSLINELLMNSALDSGKIELNKSEIYLERLVGFIALGQEQLASRKNQKIILQADNACMVHGDESRLREVIENLVSNAIKYSPHGKTIWVKVEKGMRDAIEPAEMNFGGRMKKENEENELHSSSFIRVSVRDEGPGLTDLDKQKIFGKFQRLSPRPTGGESSSGLGLAIVKQLVDLHGGHVRVESEWGKGCTFIVDLPALRPLIAAETAKQSASPAA